MDINTGMNIYKNASYLPSLMKYSDNETMKNNISIICPDNLSNTILVIDLLKSITL